jgi:hypothetical protein
MEIVKWKTLKITVITWSHGPRYSCWAVPYCPIWTDCVIVGWHARLDEHDSRRHQPAVESLPNPSEGHILSGISLQEAKEVNEWHHIHTINITRRSNLVVMCI